MADMSEASDTTPGQAPLELTVRGLHCASCVARLTKLIERVPGIAKAEVTLADGRTVVTPQPGREVDRQAVAAAVEQAGFYL